jgi:hypothetical protein
MEIMAFPNPVIDQLHIRIATSAVESDLKFELFDLVGKKISLPYQSSSSLFNTTYSFNLSYCKAGIYFITVSSPRNTFNTTFKIIKE